MFSVMLNWAYISIVVYIIGVAILKSLSKIILVQYSFWNSIITGVVVTSVYAQFFSLCYKVGFIANIVLIAVALFCFFTCKKEIMLPFQNVFRITAKPIIVIGIFFFAACTIYILLLTIGVPKFIDTYLYHAQTIRWIEEYGCVKGIANLHDRLGFNSSFHSFSALFSMKWLFGQSLHATNGWNILLLQMFSLWKIYRGIQEKSYVVIALSVSAFMYSFIACYYSSSMGADIPAATFVLILLTLWCEQIEIKSSNIDCYALISILAVYIVTIKFSCALFSLLFIYPAYLLIKNKQLKKIIVFIVLGLLVALPFFIRTVLITGWIIFPFSAIDIFSFDWKVPKHIVDYESNLISVYAILPENMEWAYSHRSPIEWIPKWIVSQHGYYLVIFFINVVFIIIELGNLVKKIITKQTISVEWFITKTIAAICFLYWLFCAPAIRFGWPSLLFFPAVTPNLFYSEVNRHKFWSYICFAPIFCILLYIGTRDSVYRRIDVAESLSKRPFFIQIDYEYIDTVDIFTLGDVSIYYPLLEGKTGYNAFPGAIDNYSDFGVELRGKTIKDGFRYR